MQRAVRILTLLVMVGSAGLVVAGCGGGGDIVNKKPDALTGSVTVSASATTLNVGGTAQLTPSVAKDPQATVTYGYSSSAQSVATVNSGGLVTAVGVGSTTITVNANGTGSCCNVTSLSTTVTITVSTPPPALTGTLTVAPNPGSVNVGSTVTLVPNPTKGSASVAVSYAYSTNQASVALVDGSGVVTGISPGQAVITVTATGSGAGFTNTTQQAVVTINVAALLPALTGTMTVTPSSATLVVGGTQVLTPNVTKAAPAVSVSYAYASNNLAVAGVSSGGTVSALTPGTANITVTAIGSGTGYANQVQSAVVAITVQAAPPAIGALTLGTTNGASITMGSTTKVVPNANPATGATVTFTYVSGTPATATVATDGTITTVAPGTTTITVTALGSGPGLTTTSQEATILITVTAVPCTVVDQTLDFSTVGSFALTDCLWLAGPGRVDFFRVTRAPAATIVRLDALAAGSTQIGVLVLPSATPTLSLRYTNTGAAASGYFLLPSGASYLGVTTVTGALGNYTVTGAVQLEDVVGCRTVVTFATVTTSQRLSLESCLPPTGAQNRYDSFLIFAPGRSCTIDMLLPLPGTTAPLMNDPYLELWRGDGALKFAENDDIVSGINVESSITLNNCVDPAGSFIEIRARAFTDMSTPALLGAYRLRVTFGP